MDTIEEPACIADVIVKARSHAMSDPSDWAAVYTMTCYDLVIAALKPNKSARELATLDVSVLDDALADALKSADPFDLCQTCITALHLSKTTTLDSSLVAMFHTEFERRGANQLGRLTRLRFNRALRSGNVALAWRIMLNIPKVES